jgi:hypothetical protein
LDRTKANLRRKRAASTARCLRGELASKRKRAARCERLPNAASRSEAADTEPSARRLRAAGNKERRRRACHRADQRGDGMRFSRRLQAAPGCVDTLAIGQRIVTAAEHRASTSKGASRFIAKAKGRGVCGAVAEGFKP